MWREVTVNEGGRDTTMSPAAADLQRLRFMVLIPVKIQGSPVGFVDSKKKILDI